MFTNLKNDSGLDLVIDFIVEQGMLDTPQQRYAYIPGRSVEALFETDSGETQKKLPA